MLSFIDSLKQVIADVKVSGGAVIEHSTPPSDVLERLKQFALQRIAETSASEWILLEWFTEGFFDEYVRVCWIHLRKLGISDNSLIYRVITKVIESQLSRETRHWERTERDFEERLALSLVDVWEQMGDEQTLIYTFARERWLIAWDYQKSCWKATSLGELLLELSPVQAVTFLLSIDTLFSTGKRDFHHISADVMNEILHPQHESYDLPHLIPLHRDLLTRLGILREPDDYEPDRVELTPVGKIVLGRVLDKDNPLRDAASVLIATEEVGDTFKGSATEIKDVVALISESELVDDANRESINTGVQLYLSGKYLDSLRVLYPSIEAIINNMLNRAGQQPERFRGLVDKARWLEQNGYIPPDVSNATEIFTSRNKVLHGNFSPPQDYVFPLCLLAFRYLRRLLLEYRAVSEG
ncbi:MAG: hypothetical protein QXS54_08975 [Candidatus Methanomethylicaceae archaeon]